MRDAEIDNPVRWVNDGLQAIDYLDGVGAFDDREQHPLPMLGFLDLKLPFRSGHEVLEWIRQRPQFAQLIVIVLTSSSEPVDLNRADRAGANSYLVRPPGETIIEVASSFHFSWHRDNRVGS